MKKAIFKGFAVAALALAVLFTGCKNEPSNIDTIRVDAVEITVKAMPGYNYVTWTMPEDYQGSSLTVVRDDGKVLVTKGAYTTTAGTTSDAYNRYLDTDVQDGVTYKYTVYVDADNVNVDKYFGDSSAVTNISDVSTDFKALTLKGNSSSASCKAINPSVIKDGKLMKAIELCDFEDGGDSDFVINEDNIVVEFNEFTGKYDIAFPTKAYLQYVTKLYMGNVIETFGLRNAGTAETQKLADGSTATSQTVTASKVFYTNDSTVRYDGPVTVAGEYTVVVEVSAVNKNYTTSVITAKNKFTVEALDVNANSGTPKAGYIDDGKTIRVLWTPATKADTSLWSENSYKVYVKDSYGVYTEIAPAKKAKVNEDGEEVEDDDGNVIMEASQAILKGLQANADVYYIDYAIPEGEFANKVAYTFYVVLSDNGKYEDFTGSSNVNNVQVDAYKELAPVTYNTYNTTTAFYNLDNDELVNDAVLTVKPANSGKSPAEQQTVTAWYKKVPKNDVGLYLGSYTDTNNKTWNKLWLDKEFEGATAVPATDYNRFDFIVKNVDIDTAIVWLYKVSQKNYKDSYYVTSGVVATIGDLPGSAEFAVSNNRTNNEAADLKADPKVTITVIPADQNNFKNYKYEIYYAKLDVAASNQGKVSDYDNITKWNAGPAVTIAWDKDEGDYRFTKKDFVLPVSTKTYAPADNYADTGAEKVAGYKDEYVFKFVVTNTNTTAEGNSVVYYKAPVTYTKTAE